MEKATPDIISVDFYKLGKIPPAFSGILVDWSIGTREITSTVIYFIEKGYIVSDSKTLSITNKKAEKSFERRFMNEIFKTKATLTYDEVSNIVYKNSYKTLLKIIADGMISEGVIDKNFQKKLVRYMKEILDEISVSENHQSDNKIPKSTSTRLPKPIIIPSWIIYCVIGILVIISLSAVVSISTGSISGNLISSSILMLTLPILFFIGLVYLSAYWINSKLKKKIGTNLDWILTKKGRAMKSHSLRLKEFMEKYPLAEDRLANMLVGHAVAFGLGTQWMKRLGKNKIPFLLLDENLKTKWETLYNFMDMDSYCNDPALNISARHL